MPKILACLYVLLSTSGVKKEHTENLKYHCTVLVLHHLHNYSIPEIAAIFDCPAGTAKSRLHHARKLLKAQLQQRYGGMAILPDPL